MSARIRHSRLLLKKYDWIFCEFIDTRRPARRALHVESDATKAEVNEPSSSKPLVRRVEGVRATLQSATAGSTIENALKSGTPKPRGQPARKRPPGPRVRNVSSGATSVEHVRISRIRSKSKDGALLLIRKIDTESGKPLEHGPQAQTSRLSSQVSILSAEIPELGKNQQPEKDDIQERLQRYPGESHLGNSHPEKGHGARQSKSQLPKRTSQSAHDSKTGETFSKPVSAPLRVRKVGAPQVPFRKITPTFQKIATDNLRASVPASTPRRRRLVDASGSVPITKRTLRKAKKRRHMLISQGFRKAKTEKHPVFRKVRTETAPSVEHSRKHAFKYMDLRLEDRPLVRRALEKVTSRKVKAPARAGLRRAKPLVRRLIGEVLTPLKIIKYDSLYVRKHAIIIPKFIRLLRVRRVLQNQEIIDARRLENEPKHSKKYARIPKKQGDAKVAAGSSGDAEDDPARRGSPQWRLTNPPLKAPDLKIRRAVGFENLVEGSEQPPLLPQRVTDLVLRKVLSEPKTPHTLVRLYESDSLYSLPSDSTKALAKLIPECELAKLEYTNSTESDNVEPRNPSERSELALQAAFTKRKLREAWLVRKGEVRLAISLMFSADSLAKIQRLRNKYNPNISQFARFKVLRQLGIGDYEACEKCLAQFVKDLAPFRVTMNGPARSQEMGPYPYRVGMKLNFDPLEQLQKALVEEINKNGSSSLVTERNTRDNDELGMIIINGNIDKAEDAEHLIGLLEEEHQRGLGSIQVEGLVLHGYLNRGDTLFPPSVEFMFGKKKNKSRQNL